MSCRSVTAQERERGAGEGRAGVGVPHWHRTWICGTVVGASALQLLIDLLHLAVHGFSFHSMGTTNRPLILIMTKLSTLNWSN